MLIVAIKLTCTCSSRKIHHKINYVTCTGKMYIKSITFVVYFVLSQTPFPLPENLNPFCGRGQGEVLIFSGQFCTVQEICTEIDLLFLIIYFGHNLNVFSFA